MIGNEVFDMLWAYPIYPVSWGFRNFHKYSHELVFEVDPQHSDKVFRINKKEDKYNVYITDKNSKNVTINNIEEDELINTLDELIFG